MYTYIGNIHIRNIHDIAHCRNVREMKKGNDGVPEDYRDSIWCITKMKDENDYEWDYCTPQPPTECPKGGVLLS